MWQWSRYVAYWPILLKKSPLKVCEILYVL